MSMTCYSIAYHFKGELKLADVKRAEIFANDFDEARKIFLKIEPNAILILGMSYDLKKVKV